MSNIRDYILTVDRDTDAAAQYIEQLSSTLQSKQTSLVEVVQSLGEYINNEDATIRAKAVRLLGQLVESLPVQFLSRQQVLVLCDFLCERIEDGNALSGLEILARLPRFTAEMAISTFRALRAHYPDLKTRPQPRRYEALVLLTALLHVHRPALRNLELESLGGILELVDGERDPRNLMIVFSLLVILISEWDIISMSKDVFDSVFCYFPITFRPRPNDPHGITAQDLKQRLESCLSASELFAPFLFPQLIDKLDSNAINVKRDVLRAIGNCAKSYGRRTMAEFSITLWDSLKYEIFNAQEEELADEAVLSLISVAKSLGDTLTIHETDTALTDYLKNIAEECNERLREPQQKQAQPAARVVGALASTSAQALECLVQSCLPPLLTLYQDAETFEMRRAILSATLVLLQASLEPQSKFTVTSPPLSYFKEPLYDLLIQALMHRGSTEISFRSVAMENLTCLCMCPGVMDISEINLFGGHLCEIVIQEDSAPTEFRNLAIASISTIAGSSPDLVTSVILPRIFSHLPDSPTLNDPPYRLLNALASLKLGKDLAGTLVRRLLNKASPVFQGSGPSEYFCSIIATVNSILLLHKPTTEDLLAFCTDKIISLTATLLATPSNEAMGTEQLISRVALILGRFTCIVVRFSSTEAQATTSPKLFDLLDGPVPSDAVGGGNTAHRLNDVKAVLRTYLFAGCKASIILPYSRQDILRLLDAVIVRSQASTAPLVRQTLLQQAALLVNKFVNESELPNAEERLWAAGHGLLHPTNLSRSSIRTGFWLVKGLLLRLANVTETISRLINLLSHEECGSATALAFELLLSPDPVLTKENGAKIRLISRQKIFSYFLAEASGRIVKASAWEKSNYLTALAGLLKYLDGELIMMEGEPLLPLVSQALALDNPTVKESAIRTLIVLVQGSAESLQSHVPSLITRLLGSAGNVNTDMVQVRHHALVALQQFATKVDSTSLMPYRQAVLNGIRPCLDDPKRFVRKDAVNCRTAWMDLDEPDRDAV